MVLHNCQAILFDYGGTLDSEGEHWLDRTFRLYKAADMEVPYDEIKEAFYYADECCYADATVASMDLRSLMSRHVHLQFDVLELKNDPRERRIAYAFCVQSERFLEARARWFRTLRSRFQLGIVSNFYGNLPVICRDSGISESVRFVLDSNRVGLQKPDAAIFRLAVERLGLSPEQVVFVGDSYERDVIPSNRAGMKAVWLKGAGRQMPNEGACHHAVIRRLAQLGELLS